MFSTGRGDANFSSSCCSGLCGGILPLSFFFLMGSWLMGISVAFWTEFVGAYTMCLVKGSSASFCSLISSFKSSSKALVSKCIQLIQVALSSPPVSSGTGNLLEGFR